VCAIATLRKKRFKTGELLVAERDWEPPRPRIANDRIVAVRLALAEAAVRERVKRPGGKWNSDRTVWEIRHDHAVALGLSARIVDRPASTGRCREADAEYLHRDAREASGARCLHPRLDAGIAR
jgi:hypothetical protein